MPSAPNRQTPRFHFEPLDKKKHNRAAFCCEQEPLNRYLREQASQDIRKRVAAVYVLTPNGKTIAGYFTLSQYAIDARELPAEAVDQFRLPNYDKLPATLLGRLARSTEFKGIGVGELLLVEALRRSLSHSRHIASFAVIVDAKDEKASAFYSSYGFIPLPGHPNRLFLPMQTIEMLFPSKAQQE